ncbi:MAG TPA: RHS repeat-associated core domain-containing protein [Streptosporangiaceae bacterium]|nr:RHS repeat-associated core domain-containing protein [Streptosporangiaceae bacterium]
MNYASRLTSRTSGSTTTSYGYDDNGNLTQADGQALTYDARNQLLTSTTSAGTTTFTWTPRGTQATITSPAGNTSTTSDAYGQAITQAGQTYAYDANGRLTAASGKDAFTLTYAGTTSQIASDGTWNYAYDPGGTLASTRVSGGTTGQATLAWTDNHTDVVGQFTPVGTSLAGSASYDPYGNITATTGFAGTVGYQSDFTDPGTSLVHMGARWYAPADGQFTSRDTTQVSPVPDPAAANPYAYAADNPLTGTDPTGHMLVADRSGGGCAPTIPGCPATGRLSTSSLPTPPAATTTAPATPQAVPATTVTALPTGESCTSTTATGPATHPTGCCKPSNA